MRPAMLLVAVTSEECQIVSLNFGKFRQQTESLRVKEKRQKYPQLDPEVIEGDYGQSIHSRFCTPALNHLMTAIIKNDKHHNTLNHNNKCTH